MQKLGTACIEEVKIAGQRRANPSDQVTVLKDLAARYSLILGLLEENGVMLIAVREANESMRGERIKWRTDKCEKMINEVNLN